MKKRDLRTKAVAEQIIISKWFHDPNFFVDFFLPHFRIDNTTKEKIKPSPQHKQLLFSMKNERLYNGIFYRWFGKTTSSIADTIHDICYGLEKSTILRCPQEVGKKFIQSVRNEFLSNPKILYYFGDLVPATERDSVKKRQTQKTLQFTNGCNLEYVSKKQGARWARATKLKVDDPQEKIDISNPKKAKEMVSYFFTALYPLLDSEFGKCHVSGTIVWPWCFVHVLMVELSRWFKTDKYPAIIDIKFGTYAKGEEFYREDGSIGVWTGGMHIIGGEVTRNKWSLSAWDTRMQTVWYDEFMQEYQHQPMEMFGKRLIDSTIIDQLNPMTPIEENWLWIEWLNIYRRPDQYSSLSFGVDTSTGNGADYSSIVARNNLWQLYLTFHGMVEPDYLADILHIIIEAGYRPKRKGLWIENNNTGIATIKQAKHQWYRRYNDIYKQKNLKTGEEKETNNVGWNTNATTRAIMQSKYKQKVGKEVNEFDVREISEMKTLIMDNAGKASAPAPYNDDLCLWDMICNMMIDNNEFDIIAE